MKVVDDVLKESRNNKILVSGHSLGNITCEYIENELICLSPSGGALANILAAKIKDVYKDAKPGVTVYLTTIGAPRTGAHHVSNLDTRAKSQNTRL